MSARLAQPQDAPARPKDDVVPGDESIEREEPPTDIGDDSLEEDEIEDRLEGDGDPIDDAFALEIDDPGGDFDDRELGGDALSLGEAIDLTSDRDADPDHEGDENDTSAKWGGMLDADAEEEEEETFRDDDRPVPVDLEALARDARFGVDGPIVDGGEEGPLGDEEALPEAAWPIDDGDERDGEPNERAFFEGGLAASLLWADVAWSRVAERDAPSPVVCATTADSLLWTSDGESVQTAGKSMQLAGVVELLVVKGIGYARTKDAIYTGAALERRVEGRFLAMAQWASTVVAQTDAFALVDLVDDAAEPLGEASVLGRDSTFLRLEENAQGAVSFGALPLRAPGPVDLLLGNGERVLAFSAGRTFLASGGAFERLESFAECTLIPGASIAHINGFLLCGLLRMRGETARDGYAVIALSNDGYAEIVAHIDVPSPPSGLLLHAGNLLVFGAFGIRAFASSAR